MFYCFHKILLLRVYRIVKKFIPQNNQYRVFKAIIAYFERFYGSCNYNEFIKMLNLLRLTALDLTLNTIPFLIRRRKTSRRGNETMIILKLRESWI